MLRGLAVGCVLNCIEGICSTGADWTAKVCVGGFAGAGPAVMLGAGGMLWLLGDEVSESVTRSRAMSAKAPAQAGM